MFTVRSTVDTVMNDNILGPTEKCKKRLLFWMIRREFLREGEKDATSCVSRRDVKEKEKMY